MLLDESLGQTGPIPIARNRGLPSEPARGRGWGRVAGLTGLAASVAIAAGVVVYMLEYPLQQTANRMADQPGQGEASTAVSESADLGAETRDGTRGDFEARIPVNLGLQYRVSDGVEIGAYYMYGTEFGIRLSLSGNPFRPLADQDIDTPPQPLLPREPLPNGARIAGLGDVRTMVDGKPAGVRFADPRLDGVVVHTRLGDVRWVEAKLAGAGGACPDDLARAIDAEYGVIDVVTFRNPGGSVLCTVALRPKGQHAVRLVSRVHAEYPTD